MTTTASRPLRRRNRPPLRIGLTPLIDVIFILLIFFMLASRLGQWNAIEVAMAPPAQSDQSETTVRYLLLKAHGRAALDGRTMALSDAQEHLAAQPQDIRLQVSAEAGVSLSAIVRVLDWAARREIPVSMTGVPESGERP